AELERDRTAAGERAAAYASAALPDESAKTSAWDEVTGGAPVSNHRAAALAEGLWQRGQEALLLPYAQRYAAEIEGVWQRRSPQLAQDAARLLFPAPLLRRDVLALVDGLLARPSLPDGLRRTVLEQRDELARALAGQEVDARAERP
ncbi:MAG: ERAP1-like C-terminal domain-containing protein, partial [Actinomycetota bacterium]|nr:ERAP1-like C-terminal domain-containing protein [Actinomycetota bacterium]